MLIGTEKLRRAGDRQAIELARLRKEFVQTRKELADQKKARELAEENERRLSSRNMCVTRNADVSIAFGYVAIVLAFIVLGLFVYAI